MKIIIEGYENKEGYQINVEMKGECNTKYLPEIICTFLKGIASHGKDVEAHTLVGVLQWIDVLERKNKEGEE